MCESLFIFSRKSTTTMFHPTSWKAEAKKCPTEMSRVKNKLFAIQMMCWVSVGQAMALFFVEEYAQR